MRDFPLQLFGDVYEETLYRLSWYADGMRQGDEAIIEICSHGGFVFFGNAAAQKIAEAQARGVRFTARIFGVAASSAADVALACDRIEMAQNSAIMIHSAWNPEGKPDAGIAVANAAQLAVVRRRIPDYTEKDLQKDRWFTSTQAMEIGLCDSIIADIPTETTLGAACARYVAKYTPTKGENAMDEEKKVEEVKEFVEEKKDDDRRDEPSVEDVLEKIVERLDDMEARLVALEGFRAACGSDDERRPEGRLASLYRRMSETQAAAQSIQAVCAPAQHKSTLSGKPDAAEELKKFNAKYPDVKRFVKEV